MIGKYFDLFKEYFKDSDNAMVTLRLSDAGATLGLAGTFKEGTPAGKVYGGAQKPTGSLSLSGLPGGSFWERGQ